MAAQSAYVVQLARPSLVDIKTPRSHQSMYTVPASWAAPPTPPEESEIQRHASAIATTSHPRPLGSHPLQPVGKGSVGTGRNSLPSAALLASSQDLKKATSLGLGGNGRETRMQDWLADISAPVTPQERYAQGLKPSSDHPLHPRPLQTNLVRQNQILTPRQNGNVSNKPHTDKLAASLIKIDNEDKENMVFVDSKNNENEQKAKVGAFAGIGAAMEMDEDDSNAQGVKRQISDESLEVSVPKRRTKALDPVRRFSQRMSTSLALSLDEEDGLDMPVDDLSPEDAARESQQVYRINRLSTSTRRHSSFRLSLSKGRPGSLRNRSSTTLRRMMSTNKMSMVAGTMSKHETPMDFWTDGRPDMIVNVAFIGNARVGKTALIRRLVHGTFPHSYVASDIQQQTVRLMVDDLRIELNLTEGGSARDPGQPSILALGWYSVVVLCFDVGHQNTLKELQKYRNDVCMYEENSVIVLAGLKKDARHRLPPLQLSYIEEPSQVSTAKGIDAAKQMRCAEYFECSSLGDCDGVDGLFDYIVNSGVELQKSRDKKMSRMRFENTVDKGMSKIADGVKSLFLFRGA